MPPRNHRVLLILFAMGLAAISALSHAPAGEGGDLPGGRVDPVYSGKYPYKTIRPFLDLLARESEGAYRKACTALGIPCDPGRRPRIQIRDAAPFLPGRTRGPAAKTIAERGPRGLELVIVFHSEYLVHRSEQPERRLLHEMTHAAMRLALGDERYRVLPRWLREGIALSVAGQGYQRVRYEFSITLHAPDLLNGLERPHEAHDYGEDFLAVDFLIRRGGEGSLGRLMQLLFAGIPPRAAVERIAGVEPGSFENVFRSALLPVLQESAREELALFSPPFRLLQKGDYSGALPGFTRVGRGDGKRETILAGSLKGKAQYYRAKCLYHLGRLEEAQKAFSRVRRNQGMACGLADDAAFFEAECLLEMKRVRDARKGFRDFIRDYPYSNFAGEGNYKYGLCAFLCRDYSLAARWCLDTWRAFPEESTAPDSLFQAARACHMLGEREEAIRLYWIYRKTYPGSRHSGAVNNALQELEDR